MKKDNIKKIRVCFIILHYMKINITINTVESILDLDAIEDSQIIIVDNCSPNASGIALRDRYVKDTNIHVLLCEENKGFSGGNNVGYQYAKEHFNSDFIIAANNDVLFVQRNFIRKLYELYEKSPFWIAGPDVYVPDRYWHQNPYIECDRYVTEDQMDMINNQVNRRIIQFSKCGIYSKVQFIREKYRGSFIIKTPIYIKRKISPQKGYRYQNDKCVIHGSCIIFDKRYINNSEYLFEPLSFMFTEEQMLKLRCYLNNRNMIYFPELSIYHYCEGSEDWTHITYKEYCKRKVNRYKQMLLANEQYLVFLNEILDKRGKNINVYKTKKI